MLISKTLLNLINKNNNTKKQQNKKILLLQKFKKLNYKKYQFEQIKKKNYKSAQKLSQFNHWIKNKQIKKFEHLITKPNQTPPVTFIINIDFKPTNTRIYIFNRKGEIKKNYSAGSVTLIGKQKIKRYVAIINIFKKLINETKTLHKASIILHLKNITNNFPIKKIINILKNHFLILSIKNFNSKQHNGCRPKKLKRLK
uniref:Ribosomal protein S11 n=1 Tax=Lithodesmium undulatum TaxID=59812 RepID=A0A7T7A9U8_LITUN|nr:ribosomal protein S11 [Lithodesmium undulatum]QQJ94656.1 ribosomal protein S11 [Lithodesmium undulatum]